MNGKSAREDEPDAGSEQSSSGIECDRCGEIVDAVHPLDAVVHPYESNVCDECVKPWDEVADV